MKTTCEQIQNEQPDDLSGASPNQHSFGLLKKITLLKINILLCLVIVAASVGYFSLSNHLVARGFAINEIKTELENLKKINQDLELQVMNLDSYEHLAERISKLDMVAVSDVEYIEVTSNNIAMR